MNLYLYRFLWGWESVQKGCARQQVIPKEANTDLRLSHISSLDKDERV